MSFEAKYPGRCNHCEERINPGDVVEFVDIDVVHVHCDEADVVERPRETCTDCFLQKPCPCEDGQ